MTKFILKTGVDAVPYEGMEGTINVKGGVMVPEIIFLKELDDTSFLKYSLEDLNDRLEGSTPKILLNFLGAVVPWIMYNAVESSDYDKALNLLVENTKEAIDKYIKDYGENKD